MSTTNRTMWFGVGVIFVSVLVCACNEHNENSFFRFLYNAITCVCCCNRNTLLHTHTRAHGEPYVKRCTHKRTHGFRLTRKISRNDWLRAGYSMNKHAVQSRKKCLQMNSMRRMCALNSKSSGRVPHYVRNERDNPNDG